MEQSSWKIFISSISLEQVTIFIMLFWKTVTQILSIDIKLNLQKD